MMHELNVDDFARRLNDEKNKILQSLHHDGITRQVALKEGIQELSLIDNHPADSGSELFERSKDLAFHSKNVKRLEEIESALQRIDEGTYGVCPGCTGRIEKERLDVLPQAMYCARCQKNRELQIEEETSLKRPVEEWALLPPFERGQRRDEAYRYGGENAWQEVARYGTASSPQDTPEELEESDDDLE